jgi:hypothetical protein
MSPENVLELGVHRRGEARRGEQRRGEERRAEERRGEESTVLYCTRGRIMSLT